MSLLDRDDHELEQTKRELAAGIPRRDDEAALCEACGSPILLCRAGEDAWLKCSGCGAEARLGTEIVKALDRMRAE